MNNPALQIEFRDASSLKPYAKNARTHTATQLLQIARSLVEFGWTNPVLIDATGGIIAGHGRVLAAQIVWEQGVEVMVDGHEGRAKAIPGIVAGQVPCIALANLSPAQKQAYIIADNRLAELAGWDKELLAMELGELQDGGFDLSLAGFSLTDVNDLLGNRRRAEADSAPPVPAVPVSATGDLWHLGPHRVLCGDVLTADLGFASGSALLWTDPPYNVAYKDGAIENDDLGDGYAAFLTEALTRAYGALRDGSPAYVCHADTQGLAVRRAFESAGFKLGGCLVWVKDSLVLGRSDYQWRHEPILYGWRPGAPHPWLGGRKQTTVQELSDRYPISQLPDGTTQMVIGDNVLVFRGSVTVQELVTSVFREERPRVSTQHPTMKPVQLIERHLKNHLKVGETVLDVFGGSGSTLIAAERLGMTARILEISPAYVDVIIKRWEGFTGKVARYSDGRTFAEVESARHAVT